jgi:hypothetical protein
MRRFEHFRLCSGEEQGGCCVLSLKGLAFLCNPFMLYCLREVAEETYEHMSGHAVSRSKIRTEYIQNTSLEQRFCHKL